MRVLFAVADGGGNIPPQLAVTRALRTRGAEVEFIGHAAVRRKVEADGFPIDRRHLDGTPLTIATLRRHLDRPDSSPPTARPLTA